MLPAVGDFHPPGVQSPLMSLPTVYVIPLPSSLNKDLLHCDTTSSHLAALPSFLRERTPWYADSSSTPTTVLHHGIMPRAFSEYDQDVHFHAMVEAYQGKVESPREADLLYLPAYHRRRFGCTLHAQTEKEITETLTQRAQLLWDHVLEFLREHGSEGHGPVFTTASGVCSCWSNECNPFWALFHPLSGLAELDRTICVAGWEQPILNRVPSLQHVVMPYISSLHLQHASPADVVASTPEGAKRHYTALYAAGSRDSTCVWCGPCAVPWNKTATTSHTCPRGCSNLRPRLELELSHLTDVLYLNGVNKAWWLQAGTGSVEKPSVFHAAMRNATFCIQPGGDTLTRKAFYESIMLGCIPVVFREDNAFLQQLAFSEVVPYRDLWVFIPEADILFAQREGDTIMPLLHAIAPQTVRRKQQLMRTWASALTFARAGATPDIAQPDAFIRTLQAAVDSCQAVEKSSRMTRRRQQS